MERKSALKTRLKRGSLVLRLIVLNLILLGACSTKDGVLQPSATRGEIGKAITVTSAAEKVVTVTGMTASATINGELGSGWNVARISGPFSTPNRADTWNVSFAQLGKTQAVETVFPETAQSVINERLRQGWNVEMEASPGKFTPQGRMGWFIIFER